MSSALAAARREMLHAHRLAQTPGYEWLTSVEPHGEDDTGREWAARIAGPPPFGGSTLVVLVRASDEYPAGRFAIRFAPPYPFHPNVADDSAERVGTPAGSVCIPDESCEERHGVVALLLTLIVLLGEPNFDSPLTRFARHGARGNEGELLDWRALRGRWREVAGRVTQTGDDPRSVLYMLLPAAAGRREGACAWGGREVYDDGLLSGEAAVVRDFDEMPLHTNLLRGVYSYGMERPSELQQRAVVPLIRGGDVIAEARPGASRGALAVAILQRVDWSSRACQALCLAPTRELAMAHAAAISEIGEYLCDGAFCHAFVGGTRIADDIRKLAAGVLVAVATPGRAFDVIRRGALRADGMKMLCIDEADELLSQGFSEQIHEIFRFLPRSTQVALFSATMPPEVCELAARFMRDPLRILMKKGAATTLEGVKLFYVAVEEEFKLETLMDLYDSVSIAQSVVYCNTRRKVDWLAEKLNEKDFTVSFLHAEMPRGERERVAAHFRSGSSNVLITTDLPHIMMDLPQHVSVIVNFDLPAAKEDYVRRVGRAGRYGRKRVAIDFVNSRDIAVLKEIQEHYGVTVDELPMDFASELE